MPTFPTSPQSFAINTWKNRQLISTLIARDLTNRYKGSVFGIFWTVLTPVFMLVIYTFVFGFVFNAKWPGAENSKVDFALLLFAGLIIFNLFAECVSRSPSLILQHANYVKKIVFPIELLPVVSTVSGLFQASISFGVWILFYVALKDIPPWTALCIPALIAPLVLTTLGISWILSSLGVYVRDIGQITGLIVSALLFTSPVFYPISALSPTMQSWIHMNPLTPAIESVRSALFFGTLPTLSAWVTTLGLGLLTACLGYAWFQATRKGFADVL